MSADTDPELRVRSPVTSAARLCALRMLGDSALSTKDVELCANSQRTLSRSTRFLRLDRSKLFSLFTAVPVSIMQISRNQWPSFLRFHAKR
jgi:hypothetical protein